MKLTEKSQTVFDYIKANGGKVTIDELCSALDKAPRSINANVTDLSKKGLVTREKVAGEGLLHIKLSGEQPGKMPLKILEAINEETGEKLKCSGDKIEIQSIVAKQKYKLRFKIDYAEKSSMEVNLYGRSH